VTAFFFETDGAEPCPIEFGGDASVLVYFLSLAFSTRYGSQHDLSKLAVLLRLEHKIDLDPLTTFADRNVEVEADERELARVWQPAGSLASTLRQVVGVIDAADERVSALMAETPELADRLRELLRMVEWAEARGARVRMTFEL